MHTNALKEDISLLFANISKEIDLPEHIDTMLYIYTPNSGNITNDGKIIIEKGNLRTIQDYSKEYETLKNSGVSWINLQLAGIFESTMVVVIEYKRQEKDHSTTSVNYSGPYLNTTTGKAEWDLRNRYLVTNN